MKNLLLLLAGAACLSLTSCKDDDDNDNNNVSPAVTRMELLTAKDWNLESMVETKEGRSIDLVEALPVTSRDDVFRFNIAGEAVRDEGPTREDGAPQIVESSTFEFVNQESQLDVAFDKLPINDQIIEMTPTRMKLRNFDGEKELITTFYAQ